MYVLALRMLPLHYVARVQVYTVWKVEYLVVVLPQQVVCTEVSSSGLAHWTIGAFRH